MQRARPQYILDAERMQDLGAQRCRKTRYRNARVARTAAARSAKEHGKPFSSYKCDACGWWHLTTHPQAKGAA